MTKRTHLKRAVARAKPAAIRKVPDTKSDPVLALAEYLISANYMRILTHSLIEEGLDERPPDGGPPEAWQEFRTYASYWLSALYVVVEGFNELKLDRAKVPEMADPHINRLKLFRNGCFHYQRDTRKQVQFHDPELDGLNWAERLHEHLNDFFADYCSRPRQAPEASAGSSSPLSLSGGRSPGIALAAKNRGGVNTAR
jgi:hypothetical protein